MTELTFLKGLTLTRQVNQKSVIFDFVGVFWVKGLSFNRMSVMSVMMY